MEAAAAHRTPLPLLDARMLHAIPTAEAMFRAVAEREGVADKFDIDSCGTGGGNPGWYKPDGWSYHEGDESDPRMTAAAIKRGVRLTSRSRPLRPEDFRRFQYVVGMDANNIRAILTAADFWAGNGSRDQLPPLDEVRGQVSLMTQYCSDKFKGASEIPDPYYGGPQGFETVLDLLDDACSGLLRSIQEQQGAAATEKGA
ncbi:protein-tyrosine phosphatase [Monoraphidium neglectum]|uniref:Protein-tyrosine phosphatase n=1 Tax=Monoraphidium neglectum TaxID=145388 RepID=A0A0D2JXD6_9CHLO|nr:protein-tyrosine phosphatase [Monoraphidium neglectum]KIZ03283.1 protein-tyrosine phosphatase [Monoraphidium neglectum]|eukprot:XP_013902302.1 protein-tyrosine phosphatase [Monoraphidium neglectum]